MSPILEPPAFEKEIVGLLEESVIELAELLELWGWKSKPTPAEVVRVASIPTVPDAQIDEPPKVGEQFPGPIQLGKIVVPADAPLLGQRYVNG